MSDPGPDRGALAFAEKVLTMLSEGRFTATYKYAVLLGLTELCLEYSTGSGRALRSVTTRQLAEKVVELYWPHTAPFQPANARVLAQNRQGQASIVRLIERFRERHAPDPSATLSRARLHAPKAFGRLVRGVEWKLIEMPLPRLQVVGNREDRFLYEIEWDLTVTRSDGRDRQIRFIGEAGDHLVRLAGLLRPLVQLKWMALVAEFNRELVPDVGLEEFLFGYDRTSLARVRQPLRELARGCCFFCDENLRSDFEVDHFVPWARYPDNGIENLVVADRACNHQKRDHLADSEHVERWLARARHQASDLKAIAEMGRWDRHPDRSVAVARSIYLRLPEDAKLWRLRQEFVEVDRGRLMRAFSSVSGI